MSAPTPAPGDDRPREGYYPDPSIPGYVRYWNGAAWVPGTSRPAPSDGVPLAPPGTPPASVPAQSQAPVPAEETGPHFFDEDPQPSRGGRQVSPAEAQHGSRPEPAAAWGADRSQQSGFGLDQDRRVSWGAPPGAVDPRVPRAADPADPLVQPDGRSSRTDGTATIPPAGQGGSQPAASGGPVVFRRPTGPVRPAGTTGDTPDASTGSGSGSGSGSGHSRASGAEDLPSEGTMTFRPLAQRPAQPESTGPAAASAGGGFAAGQAAQAAVQAAAPAAPAVPQQAGGAPMAAGTGGGQPSWAQQVHRLAGDPAEEGQPVAPWKPPVEDIFTAAARRQSATRPAGLGRRLAARLVDSVVLAAVTGVAAVPLGTKAADHVDAKVDAAKLSGETVTVWLLDGTTAGYLGIVLAVLLVFGVLYDALPTSRWGRTLGKMLCGIQVCDIEGHEPPSFGSALRRWLVYAVTGVLGVGVLGVLWCLFDKPWRQCWHDKAAHTFVAART
ncbi:RDD family protein [Streptomyces sp. NPDC050535]|uniref:RDD family protein n=1 Tax=Streptomyces sp. NPDC050535 TaxID=3365626 RepID=UPI0037AA5D78